MFQQDNLLLEMENFRVDLEQKNGGKNSQKRGCEKHSFPFPFPTFPVGSPGMGTKKTSNINKVAFPFPTFPKTAGNAQQYVFMGFFWTFPIPRLLYIYICMGTVIGPVTHIEFDFNFL
jgi:hypothetical protein